MASPSEVQANDARSMRSGLFLRGHALRPGWGILLFVLLVTRYGFPALFYALLHATHYSVTFPKGPHALRPVESIAAAIALLSAFLAMYVISLMEQRPLATYGFSGKRALRFITQGVITALILMLLTGCALYAAGVLVVDARYLYGTDLVKYALVDAIMVTIVALLEELIFRGYLQSDMTRALGSLYRIVFGVQEPVVWGFWTSAVLLSMLYAAAHWSPSIENWTGVVSSGVLGILLAYSVWRTGSVWWAIGFHAAWDWTQGYLLGVPSSGILLRDRVLFTHAAGNPLLSGGATGPEGSAFIFGTLALMFVVVRLLPYRRVYPELWLHKESVATSVTLR